MAARGMAINAPARPNKVLKAKIASRETNGLTPTALLIMRGTNKLFSKSWIMTVITMTQINLVGEIEKAIIPAGMAPSVGPTMGTASNIPATNASARAFGKPMDR